MRLIVISALLLALGSVAEAGVYAVSPAACVADRGSIQSDLYFATGGTVTFNATATGDIILYCTAPPLSFTPSSVSLTYQDESGTSSNHVTVQWIELDFATGSLTSVATVDSITNGTTTGAGVKSWGTSFTHTYAPTTKAYYMRVDIKRSTTTPVEKAVVVSISG